jgi:hypothetical protein
LIEVNPLEVWVPIKIYLIYTGRAAVALASTGDTVSLRAADIFGRAVESCQKIIILL